MMKLVKDSEGVKHHPKCESLKPPGNRGPCLCGMPYPYLSDRDDRMAGFKVVRRRKSDNQ